jgi:hypothetical protein
MKYLIEKFNFTGLVILLATLILISGCGSKNSAPNSATADGVGQGNGMISYSNEKMGIAFQYPITWELEELYDQTKVLLRSNQNSSRNSMEFSYETAVNGVRVSSIEELKSTLDASNPEIEWKQKNISKYQVVYAITLNSNLEAGQYYILDQRGFILEISYQFERILQSEKIIRAIMSSILIDEDAPIINRIWFDKTEALPGEKVTLFVEAYDELSGINLEEFGNGKEFAPYPWVRNLIGYKLPTVRNSYNILRQDVGDNSLIFSFHIIKNKFKLYDNNTYYYEFIIPKNAPPGPIILTTLMISDYSGNELKVRALNELYDDLLDYYTEMTYASGSWTGHEKQAKYPISPLKIIAPSDDPSYIADRNPPELVEIYFSKVSITTNDTIDIFLKAKDESLIKNQLFSNSLSDHFQHISFSLYGNYKLSGDDCPQKLYPWKMIERNLFQTTLSFAKCYKNYESIGAVASNSYQSLVHVLDVKLYDEMGRKSEIRVNTTDPKAKNYQPKAVFSIRY